MLSIDYELGMGICVLTNLNSNAGDYITKNFWNALYERESSKFKPDVYQMADTVFTLVFFAGVLLSVVFFVLLIIAAWDIVRKRRNRDLFTKGKNCQLSPFHCHAHFSLLLCLLYSQCDLGEAAMESCYGVGILVYRAGMPDWLCGWNSILSLRSSYVLLPKAKGEKLYHLDPTVRPQRVMQRPYHLYDQ